MGSRLEVHCSNPVPFFQNVWTSNWYLFGIKSECTFWYLIDKVFSVFFSRVNCLRKSNVIQRQYKIYFNYILFKYRRLKWRWNGVLPVPLLQAQSPDFHSSVSIFMLSSRLSQRLYDYGAVILLTILCEGFFNPRTIPLLILPGSQSDVRLVCQLFLVMRYQTFPSVPKDDFLFALIS